MQNQNNSSNYKRRPNYNNSNRSKPISYFIHGASILAVFLLSVALVGDLIGIISPKTFSKNVLNFSSPQHLEYHCNNAYYKDNATTNVCEKIKEKNLEEVKKIQEKHYVVSKSYARHGYIKGLVDNAFLIIGLLMFLRFYRRK
ncbi:MAG: hypothetical protein ACTSXL_01520 [Alphaproteobacteria bacterium]